MNTATYVLRGYSTRLYAFLLWALAAVAALTGWHYGLRYGFAMLAAGGALALVGWLCYWNPRVILNDDGVTVINPSRTFQVPWGLVESSAGQWGLQVKPYEAKAIHVWAIPGRAGVRETLAKPTVERPVMWDEHTGTEYLRVTAHRAADIINIRTEELRVPKKGSPSSQSRAQGTSHEPHISVTLHGIPALGIVALAGVSVALLAI